MLSGYLVYLFFICSGSLVDLLLNTFRLFSVYIAPYGSRVFGVFVAKYVPVI